MIRRSSASRQGARPDGGILADASPGPHLPRHREAAARHRRVGLDPSFTSRRRFALLNLCATSSFFRKESRFPQKATALHLFGVVNAQARARRTCEGEFPGARWMKSCALSRYVRAKQVTTCRYDDSCCGGPDVASLDRREIAALRHVFVENTNTNGAGSICWR